jgi:hypothetical protein
MKLTGLIVFLVIVGNQANAQNMDRKFNYNVDPAMIQLLNQYECKYQNEKTSVQIPLYTPGQLVSQIYRLAVPSNDRDVSINLYLQNEESKNKDLITLKVDRFGKGKVAYIDHTSLSIRFKPLGYIEVDEMLAEDSFSTTTRGSVICDLKSTGRAHAN